MENLILEIYPHCSSSTNNPVNSDSLIVQQKSDKFYKNKVMQLHQKQKLDSKLDDKEVLRKLVQPCHN